jgi:acyl-CoA thioesterase-1
MNWVIYLFGSGAAFFIAVALVIASVPTMTAGRSRWLRMVATLLAFLGLIVVVFSATPLPYWLYAVAFAISLSWIVIERLPEKTVPARWRYGARAALVVFWAGVVLVELPYHFTPSVEFIGRPKLYLFADSVSAGLGEAETETWPSLLAETHGVEVHNYSHMGATVGSMVKKARTLELGDGIVLLEIGGNDLLGKTTAAEFEAGLDELLSLTCGPGRSVIMFELPLPPFANEFGRAQRRLASRYGVPMIPKRVFIGVLTAQDGTVDSIHLTRSGHERMRDTVWAVIGPAFGK